MISDEPPNFVENLFSAINYIENEKKHVSAFRQALRAGLCLIRFCCACQLLFEGLRCQETMCPEQEEDGSAGFLEYAVQQQDS